MSAGSTAVALARDTYGEFARHRSQWLAAAIAYFTTFAIAPLVVIVVEIAGAVLGSHRTVLAEVYGYIGSNAGPDASRLVRSVVAATFSQRRSGWMQAITWAVFVASALGLCGAIQTALNTVWDVPQSKRGILETLKARAVPFAMMIGIAFVLLISVTLNGALAGANHFLARAFPALPFLASALDLIISYAVAVGLFAVLFEVVPECHVPWRHVWPGACASALLFVVGQFVLGRYLAHAGTASSFGGFAGLAVFLIWIYYSAQIVLLGAEFTRVYARRASSTAVSAAPAAAADGNSKRPSRA